jgi:hypothetical protein
MSDPLIINTILLSLKILSVVGAPFVSNDLLYAATLAGQVALVYQLGVAIGIMGALVAVYFYLKGN